MYLEGQHEALPALLEVICRRPTVAKCAITAPLRNLTVQELISGRSVSDESLQRRLDAAEQALSTLNTRQVNREAFSPRFENRSRQIWYIRTQRARASRRPQRDSPTWSSSRLGRAWGFRLRVAPMAIIAGEVMQLRSAASHCRDTMMAICSGSWFLFKAVSRVGTAVKMVAIG